MNEQRMLLGRIRTANFIIQETALYLDTHPRCQRALSLRRNAVRERDDAVRLYESKYGMLTSCSANAGDRWSWVAEPWPWEG